VNQETDDKANKLDDCRVTVSFIDESASISAGSVHSITCREFVDEKDVCKMGAATFRKQIG